MSADQNIDPNLDFLKQFQETITKLQQMNSQIASKKPDPNFNAKLITRLKAINATITNIQKLFNNLLGQIDNIQNELEATNKILSGKKQKLDVLQAQIKKLELEKIASQKEISDAKVQIDSLNQQNTAIKDELGKSGDEANKINAQKITEIESANQQTVNNLTTQIANLQQQLTELTATQTASKSQLEELQTQITNLEQIKETLEQQNTQSEQDKQTQIESLKNQIQSNEANISQLQQEIAGHSQAINDNTNDKETLKNASIQLQNQIDQLTADNKKLQDTILEAKGVIAIAMNNFTEIMGSIPNDDTNEELENVLHSIETTMMDINDKLSKKSQDISNKYGKDANREPDSDDEVEEVEKVDVESNNSSNSQTQQQNDVNLENIKIRNSNDNSILQMSKKNILNSLSKQNEKPKNNEESRVIIKLINRVTNLPPGSISGYLNQNNVTYDSNTEKFNIPNTLAKGGSKSRRTRKMRRTRRTRKLRKQKGGFTYTKRTKRTKIITKTKPTTTSRRRSSTKSTRKRSSK
jgi:DNA repair exonuclease SbcCD ATPase subunit